MKAVTIGFIIGASLSGAFNASIGTAKQKVNSLGAELVKLGNTQRDLSSYAKMKQGLESSKQKMAETENEIRRLTTAVKATDTPSAKMLRDLGEAKKRLNALKSSTLEQRKSLVTLGQSLKDADVDTLKFAKSQKKLEDQMKQTRETQRKLASYQSQREQLAAGREDLRGRGVAAVGTVMALSVPVKLAWDIEDVMVDVSKNVKGLDTDEDVKRMEMQIRAIGKNSTLGAEGVGRLVSEAGKIGLAKDDALAFAAVAEKMGTAFDLSADEAGSSIAKIKATMGLSIAEISTLGDAVNYIGDNTASSAANITSILKRNGGLLTASTGLATAEIAALSAALDAAAPNAEMAATAQKNLILALTSGDAATSAQQGAFEKLGFSANEMAARMQTDAKGALLDLMTALNQLSDEEKGATLAELVGKESIAPIAGLISNMEEFERTMGLVADATSYAGSMQGEYDRKMGTGRVQAQQMRQNLADIGVTIGQVLIPPLKIATGVISIIANGIGKFASTFPTLTTVVVGAAVGFAGLGVASVGLGYIINVTRTGFVLFQMTVFRVGTVIRTLIPVIRGLNLAMMANPVGLIIGGVIALGAALVWAYNKFEPFRSAVDTVFGGLISYAKMALGWIGKIGSAIGKIGGFFGFGKDEDGKDLPKVGDNVVPIGEGKKIKEKKGAPPEDDEPFHSKIGRFFGFGKQEKRKLSDEESTAFQQMSGSSSVTNSSSENSKVINFTYAPVIHLQKGNPEELKGVLAEDKKDLERQIRRIIEDEDRVSNG